MDMTTRRRISKNKLSQRGTRVKNELKKVLRLPPGEEPHDVLVLDPDIVLKEVGKITDTHPSNVNTTAEMEEPSDEEEHEEFYDDNAIMEHPDDRFPDDRDVLGDFEDEIDEPIEESEETEEGMFKIKDKPIFLLPMDMKKGGRVGLEFGGITEAVETIEQKPKEFLVDKLKVTQMPGQSEMRAIIEAMYNDTDGVMPDDRKKEFYELYSNQMYRNGDMDRAEFEFIQTEILGKDMNQPIAKKDGGLMDLGGKEMDLRGGGFVPIGKKERADDVPARLSKNEFVMTADAVRAAGGGSVNKGAKRMYNLMHNLEARA